MRSRFGQISQAAVRVQKTFSGMIPNFVPKNRSSKEALWMTKFGGI